jgi:hypothetical protein
LYYQRPYRLIFLLPLISMFVPLATRAEAEFMNVQFR